MASDDVPLEKLPPQSIEAEQWVLGAVLIEEGAISHVADILKPEDFYRGAHGIIYEAMLRLFERREPIDLITLPDVLRGEEKLVSVGGASYLALLVSYVASAANIKAHARIVREKAIFRRTINAASEIIGKAHDEKNKVDAEGLIDFAEQSVFGIGQGLSAGDLVPMRISAAEAFESIERRFEQKQIVTGVPSGFVDLDEKTTGFQPSDLILIAGRPSMGKTAFALNIAAHAGLDKGLTVAIFSLEMSREQLTLRLMASEARVDAQRVRTGQLQERDWQPLSHAAARLVESKIHIDDTAALSAMELRSRARRLKAEKGLDLLIIDYLQLMRGHGEESSREQEVSSISRSLKALAKELKIPVIALSQLNRSLENRTNNKRPVLADLRESGALEQDADVILFLYRDEVYEKCKCGGECICNRRGKAEVIIGKQRNGPVDTVHLVFMNNITRFENAEMKWSNP